MTKKIISKFQEKPKEKESWRVLWLGLFALVAGPLIGLISSFLRKFLDPISYNPATGNLSGGMLGVMATLCLATITVNIFSKKYILGERSWVTWVGLISACLVGTFWFVFMIGELLFPH